MVRHDLAGILEAHLDHVRRMRDASEVGTGLLSEALNDGDQGLARYIKRLTITCAHDRAVAVAHHYYWQQVMPKGERA